MYQHATDLIRIDVPPAIGDAEADIAALVYSADDRPDLILCAFAHSLAQRGQRVCGMVQLRRQARDGIRRRVVMLDDRRLVDVLPRADSLCTMNESWLDDRGAQAREAVQRGVDLIVVNRFGPLEASGRGFCEAIRAASEMETPVVVAVPDFEFARWTRFSNGMAIKLACNTDSLLGWWDRISTRHIRPPEYQPRTCERFK